jgi:hypothetical protein
MSLTGGKRKVNKSLKAWVAFVKKVQKEEKLSYKDAIHRAKVRKDKGEKWMTGGVGPNGTPTPMEEEVDMDIVETPMGEMEEDVMNGGRRKRRTMRRTRGRGRGRTARRTRGRASRRR